MAETSTPWWHGRRRVVTAALVALLGLLAVVVAILAFSSDDPAEEDERATSSSTTSTTRPTTTAPTTVPPPPPPAPSSTEGTQMPPNAAWWRPTKGMTWQWQLDGGPVDSSVDAEVFDVDLFSTSPEEVAALQQQGRKVICYVSVGSWEPYRPDAGAYPAEVQGGAVEGWEDERWLDIRRLDLLLPVLNERFDLCAEKGFDGIEPDWMDSFQQDTGFEISAEDQLVFNRTLADMAHARGLAIGLKNDLNQVAQLADVFDFAVVEQCAEFSECHLLQPFLDRNKPVFHAEYDLPVSEFCAESRRLGLSSIRKRLDLDPWRETC
jgi:hypothetical protein